MIKPIKPLALSHQSFPLLRTLKHKHLKCHFSLISFPSFSFSSWYPSFSFSATTCPLNITVLLRNIGHGSTSFIYPSRECHYTLQALHLLQADYLLRTGFFVPPLNTAESCWSSFQSFIDEFQPNLDIRSYCGFQTSWISQGCMMNITTKQEFEKQVSLPALQSLQLNCNTSLDNNAHCALCTSKCSEVFTTYLTGVVPGNVSDCRSYTAIYAASISDDFGPTNMGTAKCLFGLDFTSSGATIMGSGFGSRVVLLLAYSILALLSS